MNRRVRTKEETIMTTETVTAPKTIQHRTPSSKSGSRKRNRFQRGSLQKRKSGGSLNWIAFWWEDGHRKSQILGSCSTMSRPEALSEMARVLQPINDRAGEPTTRLWIVGDWIRDAFLPLMQRKWKLSTASTSGDRIRTHLIADLESVGLHSVTRDLCNSTWNRKLGRVCPSVLSIICVGICAPSSA
jgi:hypothetical protein